MYTRHHILCMNLYMPRKIYLIGFVRRVVFLLEQKPYVFIYVYGLGVWWLLHACIIHTKESIFFFEIFYLLSQIEEKKNCIHTEEVAKSSKQTIQCHSYGKNLPFHKKPHS